MCPPTHTHTCTIHTYTGISILKRGKRNAVRVLMWVYSEDMLTWSVPKQLSELMETEKLKFPFPTFMSSPGPWLTLSFASHVPIKPSTAITLKDFTILLHSVITTILLIDIHYRFCIYCFIFLLDDHIVIFFSNLCYFLAIEYSYQCIGVTGRYFFWEIRVSLLIWFPLKVSLYVL